jgi:hypothetical protein
MAGLMLFGGQFDQVERCARVTRRLDPLNATVAQRAHANTGQALMAREGPGEPDGAHLPSGQEDPLRRVLCHFAMSAR